MPERDAILVPQDSSDTLIIACDSAGGVGMAPHDTVRAPMELVGALTVRVAMAEVLSLGAKPLACSVTAGIPPGPGLAEAVRGIRRELTTAGCPDLPLVLSSEKNIPVEQTGFGVTVVGSQPKEAGKTRLARPGETLYALGVPSVGSEVLERENEIADLADLLRVCSLCPNGEVVPVGSGGVFQEALGIACRNGLTIRLFSRPPYSLYHSAGPATVLLFPTTHNLAQLKKELAKPLWAAGRFETCTLFCKSVIGDR